MPIARAPVEQRESRRPAYRGDVVNDIHSRLTPTRVARVIPIDSIAALQNTLAICKRRGLPVSVAGGRHAMGGQPFATDSIHLDTRPLNRVLSFDAESGIVEAEAGIIWPDLIRQLRELPPAAGWAIAQKQTGADRLTLGGSLAANVHGRGLRMKPIVSNVESFELIDADGRRLRCSRTENRDLFRLAIGGYGLFGVIATVRLRLACRQTLQRVVEIRTVDELIPAFDRRIAEGCLYGDFQFAIDPAGDDFLHRGVFSCYQPVETNGPTPAGQRELSRDDWLQLIEWAHADKSRAFDAYAAHYLATSGQLYETDTHQLSYYFDDYHAEIDRRRGAACPGSEIITELFVPRPRLADFLAAARECLRADADVIYGTIRLIERDDESFLTWARQSCACVIFNLHVDHTPASIERAARAFRTLIDLAVADGGSFYLTYHRFATAAQVAAAYPQFREFLRLKRRYDPAGRFQSDWYRHWRREFTEHS